MPKTNEVNISDFLGLRQNEQSLQVKGGDLSLHARRMTNLRPQGGRLEKIKGRDLDSTIGYRMSNRPTTLVRWVKGDGTHFFNSTGWDQLFKQETDTTWTALLDAYPSSLLTDPRGTLTDPDNVDGAPETNRDFDTAIYNDVLYLTDGFNFPIKYDGTSVGTWGLRQITLDPSPLKAIQDTDADAGGGLDAVEVWYKVSLYDSTNDKEGNASTTLSVVTPGAGGRINLYLDVTWDNVGAYAQKSEFADKIRIYRTQGNTSSGVATTSTPYYLVATLDNVPLFGDTNARVKDNGTTGTLTYAAGGFGIADALVGYAVYLPFSGYYQITAHTDTVLTLVNTTDSSDYTGPESGTGGTEFDREFRVLPGCRDVTQNLIAGGTIYFGDDTTLPLSQRDHTAPERTKYAEVFGDRVNRVFLAGDENYPNRLYWSALGEPDYFPAANFLDIDPDPGDEITGLKIFQGKLFIFKRNSIAVANVVGDPQQWSFTARFLSVGCISNRTIQDCDGVLLFANLSGIYGFDGGSVIKLSHFPQGSNIIEHWDNTIVKDELHRAQAIFHVNRNEYWISCTFNDSRGTYNNAATGFGDILVSTKKVASDGGGTSQNNGTFVYKLDTNQWFYQPDIQATSWAIKDGRDDELELFGGDKFSQIYEYDSGEVVDSSTGDAGQATNGDTRELTDTGATWDDTGTGEWAGATLFHSPLVGELPTAEYTILSNTSDTLTITIDFASQPVEFDMYSIVETTSGSDMSVTWETNDLVIGSFSDVKEVFESVIKTLGSDKIYISYTWDKTGDSGTITIKPQGTGSRLGNTTSGILGGTLILSELDTFLQEIVYRPNEGRHLKISFRSKTSTPLNVELLNLQYKINSNGRWS